MKKYEGTAPVAQGDMLIRKIDALPENLETIAPEKGNFILAHSETGHHHIVQDTGRDEVQFLRAANDNLVAYLVVDKDEAQVEHLRQHDTHEAIVLPFGVYEIRRQIESSPEGWRIAAD